MIIEDIEDRYSYTQELCFGNFTTPFLATIIEKIVLVALHKPRGEV
jgi:hypothetical protein